MGRRRLILPLPSDEPRAVADRLDLAPRWRDAALRSIRACAEDATATARDVAALVVANLEVGLEDFDCDGLFPELWPGSEGGGWPKDAPAARVVPDAAGGLHVAWECGGRRAELHVRADGRLAWRRVEGGVQVGLAVPVWRATASRGIDAGRGALMWMLGRTAAVTY